VVLVGGGGGGGGSTQAQQQLQQQQRRALTPPPVLPASTPGVCLFVQACACMCVLQTAAQLGCAGSHACWLPSDTAKWPPGSSQEMIQESNCRPQHCTY
jgi:hypothetical protein